MPSGANDIGTYFLPIIPSFENGIQDIDRKLNKAFDGVSKSASKAISSGVKDGVADAERAVKASSDKIVALREKEADAAGKLRVAEERLNDVRSAGKGGATLVRAEEARESALRKQAAALRTVETETRSLERANGRLADAQRDASKGPTSGGSSWLDALKGKADSASDSLQRIGEGGIGAAGGEGIGGDFLEGFSGKIAALGTAGGPIGIAIAAAATVALAGGALIANQVAAGMEQQQQQANVAAKLGVDDATMKKIADAAGQAYGANFGASINDNLDTARVAIQAGLVGADNSAGTTKLIEQLSTVSTVLGEDIPAVARAAATAVKTGIAGDATGAFDLLTKASQNGLNVSEDLLDTIDEYGTQFRKVGLSGADAFGLISQAAKGGARDTDVAADAIKEFTLKAVDIGDKNVVSAYQTLGLNAEDTARKIATGGTTARDTMAGILDKVRLLNDPLQKNTVSLGLFGTKAEDLGAALGALDLNTAAAQFGNLDGAAQRAADTIGNTSSSALETARRQIDLAVSGMQQGLATAFGPLITDLANSFTAHEPEIVGFFTNVADAALSMSQDISLTVSAAAAVLAGLVNVVGDTVGGIAKAMEVTSRFLGNDEAADDFKKTADEAFGWADGIYAVKDGADAAFVGLGKARDAMKEGAQAAQNAAVNVDLLKSGITTLPNGQVTIKDTTPENIQRVKDLGYVVTTLPNGQLAISVQYMVDGRPISLDQLRTPIRVAATPGGTAPTTGGGRAKGGIFNGLDSVASFAGGKLPDTAMIQPAVPGGGLVQWAEPSTGGEAFIPINGGDRSVDIWQETGRRLGVWKFEQGGFRGLNALLSEAQSLVGHPYSMQSGDDCSGSISQLVNAALGLPPKSDRMSTATAAQWLPSKGAMLGVGPPGTFRIGWKNGGPGGGHMAATLPDGTHVEQGGSTNGFTLGGGAAGAEDSQFTDHAYLPLNALYPDGMASGGASSPYGPGGGGAGGGTAGVGPNGQAGSYSVDQGAVQEAGGRVAEADANVREKEAKLRELKSDAKESEKIGAQNDLDKARNDATQARQKLGEAQQGKFTAAKDGKSGGDLSDIGSIFGSFLKETTGLDGSLFPDIGNLPALKAAGTLIGFFGQLGKGGAGGADGSAIPGLATGGDGGGGGFPFGMIPAIAGMPVPGLPEPGSPASGTGFGPPPGPPVVNNSVVVNGIDENSVADNVRRQMLNVQRLGTYTGAGMT